MAKTTPSKLSLDLGARTRGFPASDENFVETILAASREAGDDVEAFIWAAYDRYFERNKRIESVEEARRFARYVCKQNRLPNGTR